MQRLTASVAHELNNPLAWMTSTTAFLKTRLSAPRTPELDRELEDCATELVDGTRRLVQLSEDLRALGPEAGGVQSGDPARVTRLVKSSWASAAIARKSRPTPSCHESQPPGPLTEVLVELLLSGGERGSAPTLAVRRDGPHVVFTLEGVAGLDVDRD